jgi:3-oxoacyl-[acyl-carrier protein] reductase
MSEEIAKTCGRLDVLVNNAGVDRTPGDGTEKLLATGSITPHMSDAGWTRMLAIHLNGAFFCARAAVVQMLEQGSGSIVNMSSIAGLGGMGAIHYATAKAGLLGFTRALAREVGARGIRVNAICPGAIETPMTQNVPAPVMKGMIAATPLRRMGTADEIAAAALFLASDESSFITGQWLSPNGGIFIG